MGATRPQETSWDQSGLGGGTKYMKGEGNFVGGQRLFVSVKGAHVKGGFQLIPEGGDKDYYQDADDPFSKELLDRYDKLYPGTAMFTGGGACSGMYRGLRLWEAAVREAGSLDQEDVINALDHAKIAVGPGGPAEMVPGQHHPRMNMYIGQVRNGAIKIVKSLGVVDPDERTVEAHRFAQV